MNKPAKSNKSNKNVFLQTLLICLPFFLFCVSSFALDRNRSISQFHHTAWTANDGAPSQISALAQTEDGYLWIGSALGLFRFDGVQFEQYSPPSDVTLPSHNIYALMATPDGGLWISFRPSGLGFLKDGKIKIFNRPEELPKSQVYCFARTPDGGIWAGTHNGLALFNGSGWAEIGTDWNFNPSRIRVLFVDREGTLWAATDNTLVFLPRGSNSFQTTNITIGDVPRIIQASDGRLWMAETSRSIRPIPIAGQYSGMEVPEIQTGALDAIFDREGSLWITDVEGLKRVRYPERLGNRKVPLRDSDLESFVEKDGLSGALVNHVLEDREGNIWVSTQKGLDRFRYSALIPVKLPPTHQKLTLLAGDNGEVWAGNAVEKSMLRIRGEDIVEFNVSTQISSIYRDSEGAAWWGGVGGLVRQKNDRFDFFPQPVEMKKDWIWEVIHGDAAGELWINLGDDGLVYFKDGVWARRKPPDGLPDRGPSASFQDQKGRIWLGYTGNRVFVVDGERVQGYSGADGIEIGRIKVIRGRGANFWFGGELGLAFLADGKFHTVKTSGEPLETISGIIQTETGDLWLNEIHGIIQIPANEIRQLIENPEYAVRYRLFDFQDNLPGGIQMNYTVSTAVEASDGRLWFATDNGLAQIDPAKMTKNAVPPPVVIKSITADERSYEHSAPLSFPAGTENLKIGYTALSLSIPERVNFKYRLENLENQWREAGYRREAFYTNLGPGKYRFQVIAANNDGVWNEKGAFLDFEIRPMFYQTNWFLLLCLAAVVGAVWVGYKWRVHLVESHLKMQFEERLAERTRIAQDLHDTILQGIVGVAMQLDVAVDGLPANLPAKSLFDRIQELMGQIIEEGRNTVNSLRSSASSGAVNLEQDFSRISRQMNPRGEVGFRMTVEGAARSLCPLIHDEVFRICREALANAFHHSKATTIEVELEYTNNFLKILIRDNGIGINQNILQEGRQGHWGLSGMKERAKEIGAKVKLYSHAGAGTEVELTVPNNIAFKTEAFSKYQRWLNKLFPNKMAVKVLKENRENEKSTNNSGV